MLRPIFETKQITRTEKEHQRMANLKFRKVKNEKNKTIRILTIAILFKTNLKQNAT